MQSVIRAQFAGGSSGAFLCPTFILIPHMHAQAFWEVATGSSAQQGTAAGYPGLDEQQFRKITSLLKEQGAVLVIERMRRYEFAKTNIHELVLVQEAPAILRVSEEVSLSVLAFTLWCAI